MVRATSTLAATGSASCGRSWPSGCVLSDRRRPPSTVVLANAWHDDNKGDSPLTLAALHELRRRWPTARYRLCSLLGHPDPAFAPAFRHVGSAFPDVELYGAPCGARW